MTTHYPPQRTEGVHFGSTKNKTVKEITALMRATVRQAVKDGLLPQDWKYSIRYRTASMSQAIDVDVTIPTDLYKLEWEYNDNMGHTTRMSMATFEGRFGTLKALVEARNLLEAIHKGYNYNGSDTMTDYFDVRYYGSVSFRPDSYL